MHSSAVIPFIDAHSHLHSLPFDAWETLGMAGMAAVVLSAGNPHLYREIHDEAPDWADVQRYWDGPIRLAAVAEEKHFLKAFVAVGISSMTRVEQWKVAVARLPEYLEMPNVVALGETGIDPVQYFGMDWPLEEQKIVLEEQVRVAKALDVPVILHTPMPKKARDYLGVGKSALAELISNLPADKYKRYFLDMSMEVIDRIGLDHSRVVIDHADETIIEHVLHETGAFIGIGVGLTQRHTGPTFFTDIVERHGAERLMINSDHVAYISTDLLAIPKTIREMRRRGIDEQTIRRAVFDNANEFYALGLEG